MAKRNPRYTYKRIDGVDFTLRTNGEYGATIRLEFYLTERDWRLFRKLSVLQEKEPDVRDRMLQVLGDWESTRDEQIAIEERQLGYALEYAERDGDAERAAHLREVLARARAEETEAVRSRRLQTRGGRS